MWGGWAGSKEKSREVAHKIEMFDISKELWEQKPTHGTPPPGLWNTAYTVVGSSLFVFGGYDGVSLLTTPSSSLTYITFSGSRCKYQTPLVAHRRRMAAGWCPMVITSWWSLLGTQAAVNVHRWTACLWLRQRWVQSVYQTTSQAILYGSCGAVRKFRCYVWSDCYQILSGYNQGCIDHKLNSISPWYNSPSRLWWCQTRRVAATTCHSW